MTAHPVDRQPARRADVDPFRALRVLAAANARETAGQDVLHLEVGQPGHDLPAPVKAAIARALNRSAPLGYTEALGLPALREGISALYAAWYGVAVPPERIAVTVGASGAFILALLAAFDPGARIGIGEPGYPAYKTLVRALDLAAVAVPTAAGNRFQPTPADLVAAPPLDGIILASPANPTGAVLDGHELDRLVATCRAAGTQILMDEIYQGLVFGKEQVTIAGRAPEAFVVNSFSKYFGMTGWRIGWLVMPPAFVDAVERLAQSLFISPPTLAQHAALAALAHKDLFAQRRTIYAENWQQLADALRAAGVDDPSIVAADGAFYLYADLAAFCVDSEDLCARMLDEIGIAATPGVDFDTTRGHHYVRFSVAGSSRTIATAAAKLSAWLPAQRRNR